MVLTRLIPLLLIGFGVVGSNPSAEEPHPSLSELIEGKWIAVEGTSNGEPAPPGALDSFVLEFEDGLFRFANHPTVRYSVDDSKDPAWIDIHNSKDQVGIAEIRDGVLRLCFGVRGDRPGEFETKPNTDRTYLRLERMDPE